jgi:drug/metabolite transporter (DMT)-like permease
MTGPASSARSGPAATGIALAVLSAGTFGTSGIAGSALIGSGWSPAAAAVARLGGAAVLLGVPALLQLRGRWALLRQGAGKVTIYGLIAIGGGQLFYFNAIEYMPIGIALVFEYLGVVLVVGWLWASGAQRPRWLTVAGVIAVIAGLALLVDLPGPSRIRPIGIVWGLLEAVSLAIYFLLSAGGSEEETLPPLVMAWSGLSVGAAFLAAAGGLGIVPLAVRASDVELLHRHLSWLVPVLELSLVAAVIAYTAGIAAARRLGAKLASLIGIAEVFFAVLYAWLLLGQRPSAMEFTGGAFMLVGVILVRADENQHRVIES